MLHHQRKVGASDPLDSVSGAAGLTGALGKRSGTMRMLLPKMLKASLVTKFADGRYDASTML